MRRPPRDPRCVRVRHTDCLCRACAPDLYDLAEAALALERWRDENEPKLIGELIDTVLSQIPARVERRRWAVRALVVMRAHGCAPTVTDGALRVPMDLLPDALREWLTADPAHREAVEDLLDEENGARFYVAA